MRSHEVWDLRVSFTRGECGVFAISPVCVPLDEAVDLASGVWGGPLVLISHTSVTASRDYTWPLSVHNTWQAVIRAFIAEEAISALDSIEHRLCHWPPSWLSTSRWRVRDEQLEPLERGEWPNFR